MYLIQGAEGLERKSACVRDVDQTIATQLE